MNCKMQMLITIIDYSHGNTVADLFQKYGLPVNVSTHGYGAAKPELYDILGFGEPKKAIIISILTENMSKLMLEKLRTQFHLNEPGRGIAFILPINGISNALTRLCMEADNNILSESEGVTMPQSGTYDLIVTIVNSGYFNQVMDAAKAAGAKGGTLLHAKGLSTEEAARFLGITLQSEKDILLILASHEQKHQIMESITKEAGLATEGKGICFSLPVSAALGLS